MKTDLTTLIDFNYDGLNALRMANIPLFCSFLSPVQFFEKDKTLPSKYHTRDMNKYPYRDQVGKWSVRDDYYQPVQIGDPINLQFLVNGRSPVVYNIYHADGSLKASAVGLTDVTSSTNAVPGPYKLYQTSIDTTGFTEDRYNIEIVAGSGGNEKKLISEWLCVKEDWPDTILIDYWSDLNKQGMVFDNGFKASLRVKGYFDNTFHPKYKGASYIDQLQDISILNAIGYNTRELYITGDLKGVPDWTIQKIALILLLNQAYLDGEPYQLDDGAEWEPQITEGLPLKWWKILIRPAINKDGLGVSDDGEDDTAATATVDANAFGPNAGQAGSTEPNIISILTN